MKKFLAKSKQGLVPRSFSVVGFTLIELLVVIVIIGIIATMTTITLIGVRTNARDARRISDLKQISSALELYQADHSSYPALITANQPLVSLDGSKTYMAKVPTDPSTNKVYGYFPIRFNNYQLASNLEKGTGELSSGPIVMSALGSVNATGLVGWWALNGASGGQDLSGNGNHGTAPVGIATSTGLYGESQGAWFFNGTSYFVVPTSASLVPKTAFTVGGWYRSTGSTGHQRFISSNQFYILPAYYNNAVAWKVGLVSANAPCSNYFVNTYGCAGGGFCLDVWRHYALTYDSATGYARAYTNGNLVASVTCTGTDIGLNQTGVPVRAGGSESSSPFYGYLAQIRMYNRALSATEIKEIYNTTKP